MRKIFIADAHLRRPEDNNYRLLMAFLAQLPERTDTLYILGDLFEFWIGYDPVPFTHYYPIMEQLKKLTAAGIGIVYLEGNHDFHLGPFFTRTLGARVHPGPTIEEIDGKRIYLCHGDEVNRKDYGYRLLRFIFHSRLTRAAIHVVPPALASWIADRMGHESKKSHGQRQRRWDYTDLVRAFARQRFAEGCDAVIAGHFHTPFIETDHGRTILSVGDWLTHFTYGVWDHGTLSLETFQKP